MSLKGTRVVAPSPVRIMGQRERESGQSGHEDHALHRLLARPRTNDLVCNLKINIPLAKSKVKLKWDRVRLEL